VSLFVQPGAPFVKLPIDLVVIPVAGLGTRLLPATKSQPKEMLPVGAKPVVQYVVEEAAVAGMRRVLFVTGPGKTSIENHFDLNQELITHLRETGKEALLEKLDFERRGIEYFFTRQRKQLGLGHAILCAKGFVGDQCFVVALGDTIIGLSEESRIISRLIEEFTRTGADVVIAFQEVAPEVVSSYGIARLGADAGNEAFGVEDLVEKPSRSDAPSRFAVAARYVFRPRIFDFLEQTPPGAGGEIQLTDAIQRLILAGGLVRGVRLGRGERRYDIGNFPSYFQAFCDFALADPRYGSELREYLRNVIASDISQKRTL
jgi:UTP--glucose-1-phosphate uridylyltransferase